MDPRLQSSFIPKKPLTEDRVYRSSGRTSVFLVVSIIIFIVALAGSFGVFFLNQYQERIIATKDKDLLKTQDDLSGNLIKDLGRLDQRIEASDALLKQHISVSSVFKLLQELTAKSIRFNDLNYSIVPPDTIKLTLKGEGRSFNAVSFQSDVFRASQSLKNPLFSDVRLDDKGAVLFSIETGVDPALVLYKNNFTRATSTAR